MASAILVNGPNQVIICDNIIVMDIENLLTGWPTYKIEFTPENTGPLKLIIRLKDPVKMVHIEESTDSEAELLIAGKPKWKRTSLSDGEGKKIKQFLADIIKITEDLAGLKLTCQSSRNNSVKAKPVHLVGISKNPPPYKLKFDSKIAWPPCHRHHCRDIQDKDSIASLEML